jgi:asparagine synthase (glutamine-hydrolysing)
MCGINGIWTAQRARAAHLARDIARMNQALGHRGPDGRGIYLDTDVGLALGHTRLSIIDLSDAGTQPMTSADGRLTITFNGEVYNHRDIRKDLETSGFRFRGHSDTEVLVNACAHWGLSETLQRVNGMFAFALWDQAERKLRLVRDRIGIKPLAYFRTNESLMFASEVKALRAVEWFDATLDPMSVELFLRTATVPGERSIYASVHNVAPGQIIEFAAAGDIPRKQTYWDIQARWLACRNQPQSLHAEEAADRVQAGLLRSVKRRMISDVPLGALLSGGIDSSTVVAMMSQASTRPVKTFSIGFPGMAGYDESESARRMAAHFQTEHTELMVTPETAMHTITELPALMDEPLGDSSFVPTLLVNRLARNQVTVALSGDGADEIFGGYTHQRTVPRQWARLRHIPAPLRRAVVWGHGTMMRAPRVGDHPLAIWSDHQLERIRFQAGKLSAVTDDPIDFYWQVFGFWQQPRAVTRGLTWNPAALPRVSVGVDSEAAHIERLQLQDLSWYTPDVLLKRLDRTSMSVGLEGRVPFLDHELVELAWSLPSCHKIQGDRTKIVLRNVLSRYAPRSMFERPKRGFSIPVGEWMRSGLRDWAEEGLSQRSLDAFGMLHTQPIRRKWKQHLGGRIMWTHDLWNVLILRSWYREHHGR